MDTVDPLGFDQYIRDTLSVFLERFVERRAALLVTDSYEIAEHLAENAASLLVAHPGSSFHSVELRETSSFALPPDGSPLAFDRARFDAILVPEVRVLGKQAQRRMVELFSFLEADGVLVVGTTDIEAEEEGTCSHRPTGYQELHRTLAEHFPFVRVLGQSPFIGTSIYDLSHAGYATEIGFDTSLAEDRSELPVRVLLACAADELSIDPFTVVQAAADEVGVSVGVLPKRTDISRGEDEEQHGREIRRLENLLRESADRLRGLERELGEKAALARDLTQRLREGSARGGGGISPAEEATEGSATKAAIAQARAQMQNEARRLRAELEAASARALEAEAARVDAVLRLDEVSGYLALTEVAPADVVEVLEKERAALLGTVRGMRSVVVELEESRDAAEARLVLAIHDLEDARGRVRILERRLEEMREQFELELARTSYTVSRPDEGRWEEERAALDGERNGLLSRCLDAERSVEELLMTNESWQRTAGTLAEQIENLQTSIASLTASESVLKARLTEVQTERERARSRLEEETERRERIVELEDELADRDGRIEQIQDLLGRTRSELSRLGSKLDADLAAAERRAEAAESRSAGLREALEEARVSFLELAGSLAENRAGGFRSAEGAEIAVQQLDPGEGGGGF